MRRIFITGVRAKTGAPLADYFSQHPDVEVRGGTSDPARLHLDRVKPVRFAWDDDTTWRAAVDEIDALFVVRPDREEAPEMIASLLSMTSEQAHVVLLSELNQGYFAEGDWALRTEQVVKDSRRTWTILRPGWFMQVFTDPRFMLNDLVRDGRLALPSGGESVSWIDTRDIAAVAAHALTDAEHHSQTYELTGPESLSLPRTAQLLSEAIGRPVEHIELSMEQALEGSSGFARRNDEGAFDRIRLGLAKVVTDTVERVTGAPARSLSDFLGGDDTFARATSRPVPDRWTSPAKPLERRRPAPGRRSSPHAKW